MTGGIRPIGGGAIGAGTGVSEIKLLVPIGDITRGAWTSNVGLSLYEAVNEEVANDTSRISSPLNPQSESSEILLEATTDPGVDFGHVLKYRYRKNGTGTTDLTVRLKQGSTTIATWIHNDISTSFTLAEQPLSEAEAALITDYTDLRVEQTASKV